MTDYSRSLLILAAVLFALVLFAGADTAANISAWSLSQGLRAVLVFFYASGSYYYYQTFLTRYRIRPQLAWTMLPFVIGTASLVAARGIADGRWFVESSTAMFVAGLVTFAYSWLEHWRGRYQLAAAVPSNATAVERLTTAEMRKNVVCFAALAAAHLLISLFTRQFAAFGIDSTMAMFAVSSAVYPAMLASTEFSFLPQLRKLTDDGAA